MTTFSEYKAFRENQQLAEFFMQNEVELQYVIDQLLESEGNESKEELLNELLGGLQGLAGAGWGAAQKAAGAGLNAMGNMASQAWQGAQKGVKNGIQAIGDASRGAAQAYQHGENKYQLQKLSGQINTIKQTLGTLGFNKPQVNKFLDGLVQNVQQAHTNVAKNPSLRFGQKGVWGNPANNSSGNSGEMSV
jgi:hypothetical protein